MVNVGIIGAGAIGADHLRRLSTRVSGARVAVVFDVDTKRAAALAEGSGTTLGTSAKEVIEDPAVDAVLIASPGDTHAQLTLACIQAGKPVLCEKPLAPTSDECCEVLAAEVAHGSRLTQVGFMRRYDAGYRAVKQAIDAGSIGEVLMVHCVHRNVSSAPSYTSDMSFTDSAIHEIDTARWLIADEIVATTVIGVRRSSLAPSHLRDPQLVLLEFRSGVVVEVEIFVNCQYGYDVRCEVVGSTGVSTVSKRVRYAAPARGTVTRPRRSPKVASRHSGAG
jgi:myo-inositol 2-dehydrogenase/D-chiro-inositol 1-dehydrogenase